MSVKLFGNTTGGGTSTTMDMAQNGVACHESEIALPRHRRRPLSSSTHNAGPAPFDGSSGQSVRSAAFRSGSAVSLASIQPAADEQLDGVLERNAFLEALVGQQAEIIRAYQDKYQDSFTANESGVAVPWMVDQSLMPLIREYDGLILQLRADLAESVNQLARLGEEAKLVTEENDELRVELAKRTDQLAKANMEAAEREDNAIGEESLIAREDAELAEHVQRENEVIVAQLRVMEAEMEQLRAVEKERDGLRKEAKRCRKEASTYREALERLRGGSHTAIAAVPALVEGDSARDAQSDDARLAARKSAEAERMAKRALERVREELNEERERNEKLRGQLNEVEIGQRESGRRVEMVMGEQRGTQKALEALRRERTELMRTMESLEGTVRECEGREGSAVRGLRRAKEELSVAVTEREQMEQRASAAEGTVVGLRQECARLRNGMAELIERERAQWAGEHRELVERLRGEVEAEERLRVEALGECGRWERMVGQMEEEQRRVVREREEEVERLTMRMKTQEEHVGRLVGERDDAVEELERARREGERARDVVAHDLQRSVAAGEEARRRMVAAEAECARLEREKGTLLEQVALVEGECERERRRAETAESAGRALAERHGREVREVGERAMRSIKGEREGREREVKELIELLENQREVCGRWRAEARRLAERYQDAVEERERERRTDGRAMDVLRRQCGELMARTRLYETQLDESSRVRARLAQSLSQTGSRAALSQKDDGSEHTQSGVPSVASSDAF